MPSLPDRPRAIVHLDADAFFASVEQASDTHLRGQPVAVGGEKRGIIASASYEARKMGVYTPMPTSRARRLCPKLIVLPGDFEKYERFSRWMFSYAYDFTPDVEISSIDEGYLDLTANRNPSIDIAQKLGAIIRQSLKISVSEGIGSNKLVSQIAAKMNKPAAFEMIPVGQERGFLHPLANYWLPGIGPKTATRLNTAGLARIGQIAQTPAELLYLLLGKGAVEIRQFANGVDERPVIPASEPAKSYSHQETFHADTTDEEFVEATLRRMADSLMSSVRTDHKAIRTLTVKVRYNDMQEEQRSESLMEPTDLETDIYSNIARLLKEAWCRRVSLRLVSLKFSNLYEGIFRTDLPLERAAQQHEARRRLSSVIDGLRRERGNRVILRGHDFVKETREMPGASAPAKKEPAKKRPVLRSALTKTKYVPLQVRSYYSFLDSALPVQQVVALAKKHELPAIALVDKGNLHGVVEFVQAAKAAGIKPVIGVELQVNGSAVCLYVQNERGYRNLCRLLTMANQTHEAGLNHRAKADLDLEPMLEQGRLLRGAEEKLREHAEGLVAVSAQTGLAEIFPGRFYYAIQQRDDLRRAPANLPRVLARPVHYERGADRIKFDIVQSIRTRTLLRQKHPEKRLEGDFHFWTPGELGEVFREYPELATNSLELADRCQFDFPFGKPQFPSFTPPDGSPSAEFLRQRVHEGLQRRYGARAAKYRRQVDEELAIINDVAYAEYFLAVWDILQECRRQGIEWITRGSAADSLVCYCLEISDVCPIRFDLYFRRFLNKDRMALDKLPDIDLDFAHDEKDRVIDLIFRKYGREQVAVVGGFSTFRARSAIADVAKVLGVSEYQVRRFTEHIPFYHTGNLAAALAETQECRDLPFQEEPYATAIRMGEFMDGFPRYPKMHPCGVVISRGAMLDLTPCFISNKGYPTTHFDMESVEAIGLIKMDILAQGGLAVMRDVRAELLSESSRAARVNQRAGEGILQLNDAAGASALAEKNYEQIVADLHRLEPWDDPEVWELVAGGGARAVHHIESPAMIGLCRMCNVRDIDGLVAIVSVIRPGAANENKKLSFTRRYQGLEATVYLHPSLEDCLRSTFGMVVYEEHILQICEAFAGLPPGRADVLRRALNKHKTEVIAEIKEEFFTCARRLQREEKNIQEVWDLVHSFQGYAFCKAHSTAYGVEAYQSAWLKRYFPVEFMAGVLTNGKGFYQPLVYVLECHRLGIPVLPPSVNDPGPSFNVVKQTGGKKGIRVPVTRVKGLTDATTRRLLAERSREPFPSMQEFYWRVSPAPEEMELLIKVGAFDCFGKTRTAQFWEAQQLGQLRDHSLSTQGWLFPPPGLDRLPQVQLQEPSRLQRLQWESELFDFPVSGHPLELFPDIAWESYCPINQLAKHSGETIVTCGLIIEDRVFEQATGETMKFLTIADWTGMIETELFARTYKSYGLATVRYPVLEITAKVEPFENGRGHTLRVLKAGKPRTG